MNRRKIALVAYALALASYVIYVVVSISAYNAQIAAEKAALVKRYGQALADIIFEDVPYVGSLQGGVAIIAGVALIYSTAFIIAKTALGIRLRFPKRERAKRA